MSKNSQQNEALRWLKQAQYDWQAAQYVAHEYPAMSCFMSQQAVEKGLKAAILAATVTAPPRTHAIRELIAKVEPLGLTLEKQVRNLDGYYMMAHYPDAIAGESAPYELYGREEAQDVLEIAKNTLEEIKNWMALQQLIPSDDLAVLDTLSDKLPYEADEQRSGTTSPSFLAESD